MKYFTIYLPVEGEIKDWCRYKPTDEVFYQKYGNNAMYDKPNGKLQHITSSTIAYEKVKLFLCSRDIHFGRAIHWIGRLETEYSSMSRDKSSGRINLYNANDPSDTLSAAESNCFQVIGEVSLEAIWVKEGMEFDDGDWQLNDKWFRDKNDNPFAKTFVQIICSQCNTFH